MSNGWTLGLQATLPKEPGSVDTELCAQMPLADAAAGPDKSQPSLQQLPQSKLTASHWSSAPPAASHWGDVKTLQAEVKPQNREALMGDLIPAAKGPRGAYLRKWWQKSSPFLSFWPYPAASLHPGVIPRHSPVNCPPQSISQGSQAKLVGFFHTSFLHPPTHDIS